MKRIEKGDVVKTLNLAITDILEMAPEMREKLLNYFIDVAFADGVLDEKEMALIYDFGKKLGYPENEIAKALGVKIRKDFITCVSALK